MVPRIGHMKRTRTNVVHPFCHVKTVGTSNLLFVNHFYYSTSSVRSLAKDIAVSTLSEHLLGRLVLPQCLPKQQISVSRETHVAPSRMQAGRKGRWISTRVERSWVTHREWHLTPWTQKKHHKEKQGGLWMNWMGKSDLQLWWVKKCWKICV